MSELSLARSSSFAANPWEPGYREHPTVHRMTRSRHFLLHRRLNELSELERCCGTVSLSSPWHPFRFRHDDKCFIMLLSTFNKKCIKLAHVIRIMIITFKCLKLLLHQIDNCIWGFTGFVVCYIRPHLNCFDSIVLSCFTLLPC